MVTGALVAGTAVSAGTSIYSALSSSSQTSSYGGSIAGSLTSMILNSQLANLEAEQTTMLSGYQAWMQQASAQVSADVSNYNASLYDVAAENAITEGQLSAQSEHRTFQATEATDRTAYAAAGIAVEGGASSAGDVAETNQTNYYLKRDLIMYGAEITAAQYSNQATLARYQAGVTEWLGDAQAALTTAEGELSAASTIATAATQNQYQASSLALKYEVAQAQASQQANSAMLSGFTSAANALASGVKAYSNYSSALSNAKGYISVGSGSTNTVGYIAGTSDLWDYSSLLTI